MSEGAAMIRVTRRRTRSPDRRRPYTVFVDHEKVGTVSLGQTTELAVQPGRHLLRVSVAVEHSRDWSVVVDAGDVVQFICRPRGKGSWDGHIDLFLADPTDSRAHIAPATDEGRRNMAVKQRAVTRRGDVLAVWAHRSGYLRSFDVDSTGSDSDGVLLELVVYVVLLPVLFLLRWVRHRVLFQRGWSVGVLRDRRLLWPKKVRLERYPDEGQARTRAAELLTEVESWCGAT